MKQLFLFQSDISLSPVMAKKMKKSPKANSKEEMTKFHINIFKYLCGNGGFEDLRNFLFREQFQITRAELPTQEWIEKDGFQKAFEEWFTVKETKSYLSSLYVDVDVLNNQIFFVILSITTELEFLYEDGGSYPAEETDVIEKICERIMHSVNSMNTRFMSKSSNQSVKFIMSNVDAIKSSQFRNSQLRVYYTADLVFHKLSQIKNSDILKCLSESNIDVLAEETNKIIKFAEYIRNLRDKYQTTYLSLSDFSELLLDIVHLKLDELESKEIYLDEMKNFFSPLVLTSNIFKPNLFGRKLKIFSNYEEKKGS